MTPGQDAVAQLVMRLESAPERAERAQLKRDFAAAWSLSLPTLSRLLARAGQREHKRSDRGVPRKATADTIRQLLAIQAASSSLRKGDIMPAKEVIRLAELNGMIEAGALSADALNRHLRERGLSRRQRRAPRPHVQLATKGPNHVHQVDFSLATNWVMGKNGIEWDRWAEDDSKLVSRKGARLWRLLIVDHASGCFYVYYGAHSGETVNMLLEGLYFAWSEKKIAGESMMRLFPFRGVPHTLMYDRGSATKSQITQNVLARLGVKTIEAQGARAKGSVEVHHNIWETIFESKMRLEKPSSLDQLNDWALDHAIRYCSVERHTRLLMPRTVAWITYINRNEQSRLRELNCDLRAFLSIALTDPVTRVVRGGRFSFEGREYRVPSALIHSERIWVSWSPYDYPAVQVRGSEGEDAAAFLCAPVEKDHFGFEVDAPVIGSTFRSHPASAAAREMDGARAMSEELAAAQSLKVYGHERHLAARAAYVPKAEEAVLVEGREALYSREEARRIVREAFGGREFTAAEREWLGRFGEQVSGSEIDAAIAAIEQGVEGRVLAMMPAAANS